MDMAEMFLGIPDQTSNLKVGVYEPIVIRVMGRAPIHGRT